MYVSIAGATLWLICSLVYSGKTLYFYFAHQVDEIYGTDEDREEEHGEVDKRKKSPDGAETSAVQTTKYSSPPLQCAGGVQIEVEC